MDGFPLVSREKRYGGEPPPGGGRFPEPDRGVLVCRYRLTEDDSLFDRSGQFTFERAVDCQVAADPVTPVEYLPNWNKAGSAMSEQNK